MVQKVLRMDTASKHEHAARRVRHGPKGWYERGERLERGVSLRGQVEIRDG
jgi:hypothetical protein